MSEKALVSSLNSPEKRVRIHSRTDRGVSQLALPIAVFLSLGQILIACSHVAQSGDYSWLWWSPVVVIVAGIAVLLARGGVLEVFVLPEGLEFRSGGDVRCFPWSMIREVEPLTGYNTASVASRAFRVVLVSGSTLTFIGRGDALERIEAVRSQSDEASRFSALGA